MIIFSGGLNISSYQNVIVTGGAGFIGSALCLELLSHNPQALMIIDNCNASLYDPQIKECRIEKLRLAAKSSIPEIPFFVERCDIRDRDNLITVVKTFKPTLIFQYVVEINLISDQCYE